jgi:hypothetical protein
MASTLGIDASRIKITDVTAGSSIVHTVIESASTEET